MIRSALAALTFLPILVATSSAKARPKLVVVISIDQFSSELMQTYGPELTQGIARLRREGVFFTEAYHDHGFTETGPGHSVLLSGRFPANTGIVENRWLDRATGKVVNCVEDAGTRALHAPAQASSSNERFLGDGLGDWLQAQVPGSRVFSVSGKDRAAILMAGRRPTGVYWFTGAAGFSTSTTYGDHLPTWLMRYDRSLSERIGTDSWLWSKDPGTLEGRSGQWTVGALTVRNGTLPRLIQGAGMPVDSGFEGRFRRTPFLDTVTLEAAEALLEGEKLGRGPATDLLAISFSATDYIGHRYGILSTEMRDQMHRLDRTLGRLLDRLQRRHPGAWVVLSADHGGLDLPEALLEQGLPARRALAEPFISALQADLRATFKVDADLVLANPEANNLYLVEATVQAARLQRRAVLQAAQAWLRARPEVADAFTAEELAATDPAPTDSPRHSSLRGLLRRSFHPARSGDILVAFKPMVVMNTPTPDYITGHGTPNAYDRRVPLIFWGPWKGGHRREPVRTVDLAPTLARELGLKPGAVDGKVLDLGHRK
ncbi:MAG: alkaline phosphatase family protein [Geothrix sp.]|uniref:alkaline phosphatase family protein n=1 Tax=Geothrix sp. TaxID=1962974 RepID=UPI003BAE5A75